MYSYEYKHLSYTPKELVIVNNIVKIIVVVVHKPYLPWYVKQILEKKGQRRN